MTNTLQRTDILIRFGIFCLFRIPAFVRGAILITSRLKPDKYKYLKSTVIILLFQISPGFSEIKANDDCTFTGKVHPQTKYQEVAELYHFSCNWFTTNFNITFDPEIVLNNVYYVENWDNVHLVKQKQKNANLAGLFYHITDKYVNDIYFNTFKKTVYQENKIADLSIIFHEMIHFFLKKANFEIMQKEELHKHMIMFEAFIYWAQDQYIKSVTNGEKGLMDYLISELREKVFVIDQFQEMSYKAYHRQYGAFLYNAIRWFSTNTQEKYIKLINSVLFNTTY